MPRTIPSVASVIVCAFAQRRWPDLVAAVDSLVAQSRAVDELIVVVDHNRELYSRARSELPVARVLENHHPRGLSGARNTGLEAATGDVLAFMDDDAVAERDWLATLLAPYRNQHVIAVGGEVIPQWEAGRPRGFPSEFDWIVGCSYRGLPATASAVRNLIGANMSFRREVFEAVGGFSDGIGRIGSRPLGCEETELCIRAGAAFPDDVILYEPAARVWHRVPATRASWRYFGTRCYSEGLSKALVASHAGRTRALSSERAYAMRTVPSGMLRDLVTVGRGDPSGLLSASAAGAGLLITGAGFLTGNSKRAIHDRRRQRRDRREAGHERQWVCLDVHGRVGIRVSADAPGARQLAEMFAPFRVERLKHCELTVRGRLEELEGMVQTDDGYRYRSDALELPAGIQVIAGGEHFRLAGSGELLGPVLALLDALVVRSGAAMVHSAAVTRAGRGVCLAATGGAGKTTSTIALVREHGFSFMGDDWTFLSEDACVLGYAKPLFVRPHHRSLFPELFAQKRKPLAPARLVPSLGRVATAVHPLISLHPGVARVARGWWPEHMIVDPRKALPGIPIETSAALEAVVFVERAACGRPELEPRDAAWMASRLVGDFVAAMPRAAWELQAALASAGLLSLDAHLARKGDVLRRALDGAQCFSLRVPEGLRAEEASEATAQRVERLVAVAHEPEVIGA